MENLPRIIAAYEKMDKRSRDQYIELMEGSAEDFPMRQKITLKLISNNARARDNSPR